MPLPKKGITSVICPMQIVFNGIFKSLGVIGWLWLDMALTAQRNLPGRGGKVPFQKPFTAKAGPYYELLF